MGASLAHGYVPSFAEQTDAADASAEWPTTDEPLSGLCLVSVQSVWFLSGLCLALSDLCFWSLSPSGVCQTPLQQGQD